MSGKQEMMMGCGDCAKMREALKATLDLFWDIHNANRSPQSNQAYAVIRKIKATLAAPPRNCDVGTAEEQDKRYAMFMEKHWTLGKTALQWAQMPYEEGGAK